MNLFVLTENQAGGRFLAEHGLSYLVETDGQKILFDTGHTDVFLKNAKKLGFNLQQEVNHVVLSHGHWDHGDGLQFLENKTLVAHPGSFMERFRKSDRSPVGLGMKRNEIEKKFELLETTQPFKISENLFFLGEIPRVTRFESNETSFELENGEEDFIPDDSALAAIAGNELVVITGCSHSGICNICEQARKVTGITTIKAVIGGFHLKYNNRQTQETMAWFKKNAVERLLPSHCTELPALAAFYREFDVQPVKTGMVFRF